MSLQKTIKHRLLTSCVAGVLAMGQSVVAVAQAADSGRQLAQSGDYGNHDSRWDNDRDRGDRDRRSGDRDRGDRDRGDRDRRSGDRDRGDRDRGDRDQRSGERDRHDGDGRPSHRVEDRRGDDRHHRPVFVPQHRGHPVRIVPGRTRHYRNIIIVRPHGRWYYGYGHYHRDNDAFKWLAFTAITLGVLNFLSESQQRAHEDAQIRATTAPIGDTIHWREGGNYGSVTPLRDGYTDSGGYCREFQQTITVGGRSEEAYGTACQQPDGAWKIVDTTGG
jgi:hypothetical protein